MKDSMFVLMGFEQKRIYKERQIQKENYSAKYLNEWTEGNVKRKYEEEEKE